LLKAVAELTGLVPEAAWLHAFTVGSLGLMMLGLMTRVALRHTGRLLVVPAAMKLAYAMMFSAALLRLAATVHELGDWAVALSAVLWGLTFLIYFLRFGAILLRPSLPRVAGAD
ncbi:MAG: NnrS family protein, partial [Rhodocyclaceae bacterium]|nr:NnrS family protein [Rhodocyclaceae bacterium]